MVGKEKLGGGPKKEDDKGKKEDVSNRLESIGGTDLRESHDLSYCSIKVRISVMKALNL